MDATGGWFGMTVMETVVAPVAPSGSVPVRVMVWLPSVRSVFENDPPVPIPPSRLEVQDIALPESEPVSGSPQLPWNWTDSPKRNDAPEDGELMPQVGGPFGAEEESLHPAKQHEITSVEVNHLALEMCMPGILADLEGPLKVIPRPYPESSVWIHHHEEIQPNGSPGAMGARYMMGRGIWQTVKS
jgi:hypothetical protein